MTLPVERYKDAYHNHRWNPFTDTDMAIDKTEDNLFIPGSAPYVIQMLEQPRYNDPTSVDVYCYDDVGDFTEVAGAPAQGQFRVDYPIDDGGEGTGLIEFNNLDAGKELKIEYKATGSVSVSEFLDTKVSYPAASPSDHQIIGFESGAPEWRYNPVCYFHDDNVVYHADGESESCLYFRFKKTAQQATVILDLKGAKLHQSLYTELPSHLHAFGTLVGAAAIDHTHGVGTFSVGNENAHTHAPGTLAADAEGDHSHAAGTIATSNESAHTHEKGTIATENESLHTHPFGTLISSAVGGHTHAKGTLAGSQVTHTHSISNTGAHTHGVGSYVNDNPGTHAHGGVQGGAGQTDFTGAHSHSISGTSGSSGTHNHGGATGADGGQAVTIAGVTGSSGSHQATISGSVGAGTAHLHVVAGTTAAGSAHNHGVVGSTADAGAHGHTISGASAVGSIHTHAFTGTSAAGGAHNHILSGDTALTATTPKTYSDELKVYINDVDKTADILALTALAELGDGTAIHAFVTTGTGEMDISALVAANQIHEIKITEPTAATGGRVLVHAEIY